MTDYNITLPDGTTVEAPNAHECLEMADRMREDSIRVEVEPDTKAITERIDEVRREAKWDSNGNV